MRATRTESRLSTASEASSLVTDVPLLHRVSEQFSLDFENFYDIRPKAEEIGLNYAIRCDK